MADALKDVPFKTVQVDALVRATDPTLLPHRQPRHFALARVSEVHT